ncbi:MAG: phenylacetate--CoA ligase family protein [Phycisphaerae bacterium]|nr:phenylacetate--CoA ligase family protein [Phycisphaerae bacterium]
MIPFIARNIIYPLQEKLCHRRTMSILRQLRKSQWYSREQLREIQLRKLQRLVSVALNQTDYYAEFAGLAKDWLPQSLGDLQKLPLLSKTTISQHRDELVNRSCDGGALPYRTGGSSGQPLIFCFDKRRQGYDKALRIRTHEWWGIRVGDREGYIWNSPVELGRQDKIKRLRDWTINERLFPASELSESSIAEFVDALRRFAPKSLFGYPNAVTLMCKLAGAAGLRLDDIGVEVFFSTAEVLHDWQRELISDAFGGIHIANCYGSREAGFIAHECGEGGMHISSENVIVEVLRDGVPAAVGQDGEIVVTQLDSLATPFIRYRTDDIGQLSDAACPCGRELELMQVIRGRSNDFLIAPDGRCIHSSAVHAALSGIPGINKYQLHQQRDGYVRILLVCDEQYSAGGDERLLGAIRERLGAGGRCGIEHCQNIPQSSSGKYRYVISELSSLTTGRSGCRDDPQTD